MTQYYRQQLANGLQGYGSPPEEGYRRGYGVGAPDTTGRVRQYRNLGRYTGNDAYVLRALRKAPRKAPQNEAPSQFSGVVPAVSGGVAGLAAAAGAIALQDRYLKKKLLKDPGVFREVSPKAVRAGFIRGPNGTPAEFTRRRKIQRARLNARLGDIEVRRTLSGLRGVLARMPKRRTALIGAGLAGLGVGAGMLYSNRKRN